MTKVYTDGACAGNPGPGGWGAIIVLNEDEYKVLRGYELKTTNNRMELIAVINAIEHFLKREEPLPKRIEIYSDSAYVVNTVNEEWIKKWRLNGWKKADKMEVQNKDLWILLSKLLKLANVKLIKVKGHSGNRFNEEADRVAVQMRNKAKEEVGV